MTRLVESTSRRMLPFPLPLVSVLSFISAEVTNHLLLELGIDLGTVTFDAYYDGVRLGRKYRLGYSISYSDIVLALSGDTLILQALSTVTEPLAGRIVPQSGGDLNTVGNLFTDYLLAQNISLIAKGVSVVPTGSSSPVSWLSTAFTTVTQIAS